ncbi:MAG TPA: glycosyltransferase family 39 protein [Candidatus Cybelea sp.]|nr:glycosyltransferase family 39 protein [Candidatus Cybelea sp.]
MSKTLFYGAVALILTTLALLQITSVRQEAQTWDEAVYISAGYTYWKTGDFRLNGEHPPLAKLLVAAPLLFLDLTLPLDDPAWQKADEYAFGARFLYKNRLPPDTILFASRCVTISVTMLFGLVIVLWVRRRAGPLAAIVALILFAFDPNIIAHGRYATNDLYLAFFFFLTIALWNRALRLERPADYALAGCALGLAVCTKLSAVLLVPAAALLCLARPSEPRPLARGAAITALAAIAIVAILYHGQLFHYRDVVRDSLDHARGGQLAYLFGSTFRHGHWYFYPAVAAVKTPVAVFILVALTVLAILRRKRLAPDSLAMLLPATIYAIACIGSPIDLGIRILLPVYPLLYAFIALNLPLPQWRWAVAGCVALLVAESATIYPNYLAFFNALSGGPAQGPRYLLDSNIDWGQDTKKLNAFLQTHDVHGACTAYFGTAYPFYYGIVELPWPGYVNPSDAGKLDCVVAVSVTWLYGGPTIAGPTWGWLRAREPDARIGYSIYLYDFRKHPASPLRAP